VAVAAAGIVTTKHPNPQGLAAVGASLAVVGASSVAGFSVEPAAIAVAMPLGPALVGP